MAETQLEYTTTGQKELVTVSETERVTVLVDADDTTVYDLEIRAYSGSSKRVAPSQYKNLNGSDVFVLDGPATGVGVNISAITGTLTFEVVNVRRG